MVSNIKEKYEKWVEDRVKKLSNIKLPIFSYKKKKNKIHKYNIENVVVNVSVNIDETLDLAFISENIDQMECSKKRFAAALYRFPISFMGSSAVVLIYSSGRISVVGSHCLEYSKLIIRLLLNKITTLKKTLFIYDDNNNIYKTKFVTPGNILGNFSGLYTTNIVFKFKFGIFEGDKKIPIDLMFLNKKIKNSKYTSNSFPGLRIPILFGNNMNKNMNASVFSSGFINVTGCKTESDVDFCYNYIKKLLTSIYQPTDNDVYTNIISNENINPQSFIKNYLINKEK